MRVNPLWCMEHFGFMMFRFRLTAGEPFAGHCSAGVTREVEPYSRKSREDQDWLELVRNEAAQVAGDAPGVFSNTQSDCFIAYDPNAHDWIVSVEAW